MGEGNTSSYRWQEDRKITAKQNAIHWHNQYMQMKAERDWQANQNIKLARRVVELEKLLTFKRGDEVRP